jgi:hypothetical protein
VGGDQAPTIDRRRWARAEPLDEEANRSANGPIPLALRHLGAGPEPPDHPLKLLPQPLGVRAEPADRRVGFDELPLVVGELPARHTQRPTRFRPRTGTEPED